MYDENMYVSKIKYDPAFFFRFAKRGSKSDHRVGPLRRTNGTITDSDPEISNILLNQFCNVSRSITLLSSLRLYLDPHVILCCCVLPPLS